MLEEGVEGGLRDHFMRFTNVPGDTDYLRSREGGKEHWEVPLVQLVASLPTEYWLSRSCSPSCFQGSALHAYVKAHIVNQLQHFPH